MAQPYDGLVPENWFPLTLGSYWHYAYEYPSGITGAYVEFASSDTLVEGRRWVLFEDVYCWGPACLGLDVWYHFTDDHYVRFTTALQYTERADTLLPTKPYSVFGLGTRSDTLSTSYAFEQVAVWIDENPAGNVADSTHLLLGVFANALFNGSFVYKIGQADSLVGAVVDGLRYGDTWLIESIMLDAAEHPPAAREPRLDVFPSPSAGGRANIVVTADRPGLYTLQVHDVLGHVVFRDARYLGGNQSWRIAWSGRGLSSGVYLVGVTNDDRLVATETFVHAP